MKIFLVYIRKYTKNGFHPSYFGSLPSNLKLYKIKEESLENAQRKAKQLCESMATDNYKYRIDNIVILDTLPEIK